MIFHSPMKTLATLAGIVVLSWAAYAAFDRATDAIDSQLASHPRTEATGHYIPSEELMDRDRHWSQFMYAIGVVASVADLLLVIRLVRSHSSVQPLGTA